MSPPYIQPYLFFGGQCTAALDYYTKHLGAETIMILRYQDSPEPPPPGMIPDGWGDKVMHAAFHWMVTVPEVV